mmetsp:Transcript_4671/g.17603  ORF Transcript_4671/g.17603 Transcript_4671/m.17603 type:complete len:295 (+) Transcript_4671:779-1663(+)
MGQQRVLHHHDAPQQHGGIRDLLQVGQTLGLVAVQYGVVGDAAKDQRQLPGHVGSIPDARIHALALEGRHAVRRVSRQEHRPQAPLFRAPRVEGVDHDPLDLKESGVNLGTRAQELVNVGVRRRLLLGHVPRHEELEAEVRSWRNQGGVGVIGLRLIPLWLHLREAHGRHAVQGLVAVLAERRRALGALRLGGGLGVGLGPPLPEEGGGQDVDQGARRVHNESGAFLPYPSGLQVLHVVHLRVHHEPGLIREGLTLVAEPQLSARAARCSVSSNTIASPDGLVRPFLRGTVSVR